MKMQKQIPDQEKKVFSKFRSPYDIQLFLNSIAYNSKEKCKSPFEVMKERSANCLEGAIFAAAALKFLGYTPLVLDMSAENDDDHVIAVFRRNGCYGAVAKSNTTVLRFREPVYKSIRELVMSYFEVYFNILGEKTLRTYSMPISLDMFSTYNWISTKKDLNIIGDYLYTIKHYDILTKKQKENLSPVEPLLIRACFLDAVKKGIFKPKEKGKKGGRSGNRKI
ncbi:MAG: hypothetical protein NTV63_00270 [Candidatus Woesearchaeota archaeon]|nr:hypothetical protein [Candidatus Woesearchaeota archaeon]